MLCFSIICAVLTLLTCVILLKRTNVNFRFVGRFSFSLLFPDWSFWIVFSSRFNLLVHGFFPNSFSPEFSFLSFGLSLDCSFHFCLVLMFLDLGLCISLFMHVFLRGALFLCDSEFESSSISLKTILSCCFFFWILDFPTTLSILSRGFFSVLLFSYCWLVWFVVVCRFLVSLSLFLDSVSFVFFFRFSLSSCFLFSD